MKMTTLYAALSGAFLLGAAALVPAQTTPSPAAKAVQPSSMENKATGISRDEYKREKDRVEADAKAAKEKCKSMSGNAKDICQAEAKATEKVAKKELDYKKNPNEKNKMDLEKMKIEAAHEVAKEKCEDQKGADMIACKKNAKADKEQQQAALKGKTKNVATNTTGSGTAARTGSTAGNTGGSATSSTGSSSSTPATAPSSAAPAASGKSATGGTGASSTNSTQGTSGK